ncbi:hypothetical protein ACLX1H_008026 [Fusarium chlamydosporum]
MYLPTVASLLVLAGYASATCHGSGMNWPGVRYNMVSTVEAACRNGVFRNTFGPGETKYFCSQWGSGSKLEFSIRNQNNGASFNLNPDDCVKEFKRDIEPCDKGGYHTQSGWEFSADPNEGRCG